MLSSVCCAAATAAVAAAVGHEHAGEVEGGGALYVALRVVSPCKVAA